MQVCHPSQPGSQRRGGYNIVCIIVSCGYHVIDCIQEVDEVYYLVFPSSFVILAVGQSLSGYEIKVSNYTPLCCGE